MKQVPTIHYEPPPLYFMHIMKTAGSSLRQLLESAYHPSHRRLMYTEQTHEQTPATLGRYRYFASHWGSGLLPFLPHAGLLLFTMLRDPVEQFVSFLYYRQRQINTVRDRFPATYLARVQSLQAADERTLIESPIRLIPDNPQTVFLGVHYDVAPYFKNGALGCQGRNWHNTELDFVPAARMPAVVQRAHQQLEQMTVVGLTEHFAESAALMVARVGVPLPSSMPQANLNCQKEAVQIHRYRRHLPPDLLAQVAARTRLDQELYAHARECFTQQWARHQSAPQRSYSIAPRLRRTLQTGLTGGVNLSSRLAPQIQRNPTLRRCYQVVKSWMM